MTEREKKIKELQDVYPPIWAVYEHPTDYPENWVVRIWYGTTSLDVCTLHDSLKDARASIPRGAVLLTSKDINDSTIYETWI